MILDLLLIIVGLTLVVWGADKLTEGASSLARGMKVPEMVIGLTIVAAGTSAGFAKRITQSGRYGKLSQILRVVMCLLIAAMGLYLLYLGF